jgi:hypothetical protein
VRRWLIRGVIVLVVALALLGAYASYHGRNNAEPDAHQELLRAPRVFCAPSFVQGISGPVQATSYRCTSTYGARVAAVQVRQPFARTPIKSKLLSAMVANETRRFLPKPRAIRPASLTLLEPLAVRQDRE